MTAAIVIVDHLDEIGAFQKASKVLFLSNSGNEEILRDYLT